MLVATVDDGPAVGTGGGMLTSGEEHLYRGGAEGPEERKFERRYGERKGKRVYGAVVGKVAHKREAEVEDDRTVRRGREHDVEASKETVRGREFPVRPHRAKNPRR